MKRLALLVVFALPGCNATNVKDILTNLDQDCTRHYAGSLASGVPASGTVTFTIDCQPSGIPSTKPAGTP